MSVEVKTPTRTQFEHTEWQCGERTPNHLSTVSVGGIVLHSQESSVPRDGNSSGQTQSVKYHRKRKLSERGGNPHQMGSRKKAYRKGEKIVLPSKFLLGGNITDPLNLNALYDDDIGRALNQTTPQSSPMPVPPYKQEVQVLIPPNINDPLNLNAGEDDVGLISPKFGSKKKKHKHKKKRLSIAACDNDETVEAIPNEPSPTRESSKLISLEVASTSSKESTIITQNETLSDKLCKIMDKIVSPVIPQLPAKTKKVKRLSSDVAKSDLEVNINKECKKPEVRRPTQQKPKAKQIIQQNVSDVKTGKNRDRYMYGNYDRYYGYRNPGDEVDNRLQCFRAEWFKGKDVLDIGCNIGHITLSVARDYQPHMITGMDIDPKLIGVAKKNIRHYMTREAIDISKFPSSLHKTYGPIAPPPVPITKDIQRFPYNVMFVHGNYVLKTDEELELVQEQFDTIIGLSLTKWIHLNFGDTGIKRMFKRVYKQLRPGGVFILEPQPWSSYKRKKKVTEAIFKTFQEISFRPEQFTEYLLSKEVGFVACEHLEIPFNTSEGFQRPLQVYIKSESGTSPVEGVTPLMDVDCTPSTTPHTFTPHKESSRGATPKITPCSSCQNTPTWGWSASGTPRYDSDTGDGGTPRRTETDLKGHGKYDTKQPQSDNG